MTTEEKFNNDGKRDPLFGFPFGCPEKMEEMMRTWCPPEKKLCNCCPMAKKAKDEQSK